MVPPYSGAVTILPVAGSRTISFSAAAVSSSPAGLPNVAVATRANTSGSNMSLGVITYSSSFSGAGLRPVARVFLGPDTPAVSDGAGGRPTAGSAGRVEVATREWGADATPSAWPQVWSGGGGSARGQDLPGAWFLAEQAGAGRVAANGRLRWAVSSHFICICPSPTPSLYHTPGNRQAREVARSRSDEHDEYQCTQPNRSCAEDGDARPRFGSQHVEDRTSAGLRAAIRRTPGEACLLWARILPAECTSLFQAPALTHLEYVGFTSAPLMLLSCGTMFNNA